MFVGVGPVPRCPRLVPTLPVSGPAGDFIFVTGTDAAYIANNAGSYQIIDTGPISSGLTVGSTTITGGATTRLLYDNGGVLGETAGLTTNGSTLTQTSSSATAFQSGPNGGTNPVFRIVNSTASQADGISVTGLAAGSGTTITALSSGADSPLTFTQKGTGPWVFKSSSGTVDFRITDSGDNLFFKVDQANGNMLVRGNIIDVLTSGSNYRLDSSGYLKLAEYVATTAPVTKTDDFTWAITENWIIVNKAGSVTATLPTASSFTGRSLYIKTIQNQTVVSATSNVVPLVGGSAGTAILSNTAGKWATMVSDGTNWIIMAGN